MCIVNQFLKVLNCKTLIFFFLCSDFGADSIIGKYGGGIFRPADIKQVGTSFDTVLNHTGTQIWYSAQTNVANAVHSEFVWIIIFKRNQLMVYNLICGSLSINPVYF